jgi:hypothetical protein
MKKSKLPEKVKSDNVKCEMPCYTARKEQKHPPDFGYFLELRRDVFLLAFLSWFW